MQAIYISNGNLLATTAKTYGYGIKIWNLTIGIQEREITVPPGTENLFVSALTYSENLNTLYIAYEHGRLGSYNLTKNKFFYFEVVSKFDNLSCIAFSSENNTLIVVEKEEDSSLNYITTFDGKSFEKQATCYFSGDIITCLSVFYSSEYKKDILAIGTQEGKIVLKDVSKLDKNNKELSFDYPLLHEHVDQIRTLAYNPKTNHLVSGGNDCGVVLWNLNTYETSFQYSMEDTVHCVTFISEAIIAVSGSERAISFLNIENAEEEQLIHRLELHTREVNFLQYNKGTLLSASYDKDVILTDLKIEENTVFVIDSKIINGHTAGVKATQLDYAHGRLVTIGTDKSIRIWDIHNMRLEKSLKFSDKKEYFDDFILLNDDLDTLIKVDSTKNIKFYSLKLKKWVHTITESSQARCIINLFDGMSFLVGFADSRIGFYKYRVGTDSNEYKNIKFLTHSPNESEPCKLKITTLELLDYQSSLVASGAFDGSVVVYELGGEDKFFLPPLENSPIIRICKLRIDKDEGLICVLHLNENWSLVDFRTSLVICQHNLSNISWIDRLNNSCLVMGFSNTNKISFYDPEEKRYIREIEVTFGLNRPVFYLRDSCRIIAANGKGTENFAIDVIKFK